MDDFEWNVLSESKLFEAMVGHKPVGVNKYFQMACIWNKFTEYLNKDVSSEKIWTHLESMYNLESLDDIESLPFPNDERDFNLPEPEFGALKAKKEEKTDDKAVKSGSVKRNDVKDMIRNVQKEVKRDEKVLNKKETPRRDSKDGKEVKTNMGLKKDMKKEPEKLKQLKGRSSIASLREDDKSKALKAEDLKRLNKRPTRASIKPEESSRKSQSPLTVTPSPASKRRRL